MDALQVKEVPPETLIADARNARTHSDNQIDQIARSIKSFGFNNPILIDSSGIVIAGHGRLKAALNLGMATVPTIRLDHMTPEQRRAYVITDNRLGELSRWDRERLAIEFESLSALELDFEITDLGFEMPEIDFLLDEARPDKANDHELDDLPRPEQVPELARPGDLWAVGPHLIFCGDALDELSYRILLDGEKARTVFTDPPYNVPIKGHVSGLGRNCHREFLMASGEMAAADFRAFLASACEQMAAHSIDGALHFICIDWRHVETLVSVGNDAFSELKNICVWVKPSGGMGALYRSRHELVCVFKVGQGTHLNNIRLGKYGRYRTNVWEYEGMNGFHRGRSKNLAMHPTVKPVAMIADAIMDCSERGDIVLDPFAGSGSTLLAAQRAGRRGRAIELDPRYVDVTLARLSRAMSMTPINLVSDTQLPLAPDMKDKNEEKGDVASFE